MQLCFLKFRFKIKVKVTWIKNYNVMSLKYPIIYTVDVIVCKFYGKKWLKATELKNGYELKNC